MPYSGTMIRAPWEEKTYRNRHGRGVRTPPFGRRLPRYRTRSGMFDDMAIAQIRRLNDAWPQLLETVAVRCGGRSSLSPSPWETNPRLNSQAFPASHGIPARVVLYRMPLQSHARSRMDLQLAIRDELVLRIAELYGRRPEEIDPQWGM